MIWKNGIKCQFVVQKEYPKEIKKQAFFNAKIAGKNLMFEQVQSFTDLK